MNLNVSGGSVRAYVRYGSFKKVLTAAQMSGMNVNVLKRSGIPFIFRRYRLRVGIPAGVVSAFLLFALLSSMVWSVDIAGNERISEEKIYAVLEEAGVKRGAFKDSIDKSAVEELITSSVDGVLWNAVNIIGSKVYVEIRETIQKPDIVNNNEYVNIVAAKSGEIINADVLEGDGELKAGSPVVKGDLLVSGVIEFKDGSNRFVHAKAVIMARTVSIHSTSTALKLTVNKPTVWRNRHSVYIFGLKIPLGFSSKAQLVTSSYKLVDSRTTVVPLGIVREHYASFEKQEKTLTENEALLLCFSDFAVSSVLQYAHVNVVGRSISVSTANQLTIEAQYICEEDIAEEKMLYVE